MGKGGVIVMTAKSSGLAGRGGAVRIQANKIACARIAASSHPVGLRRACAASSIFA